ncbi:endonuclease domain-containing 1 protein-like [Mobula hypostoma]|uniref:endonuclease domain-containing 1 protein-like n=1 Tax=Mobula hypostoma TaxID=723540 RepID=UPI002FC2CB54
MAFGLSTLVWFLLLAISQPGTVQGRVVADFRECNSFFKDGNPPQGFENMGNLVRICQVYKNQYRFATLYRTDLRIPVYSAYKYQGNRRMVKGQRICNWCHEPQIDDPTASPAMIHSKKKASQKQAMVADYRKSGYEQGHLYPFDFNEGDDQRASFTLTNAIPMSGSANKKWYHYAEKFIKILAEKCQNNGSQMYVVTGSANYTGGSMSNKVAVPELIWSAACCTSSGSPVVHSSTLNTKLDFSIAYMKELLTNKNATRISVRQLQRKLNVTIFQQCRGTSQNDEVENNRLVNALLNEIPRPRLKRKRQSSCVAQSYILPRQSNSK